MKDNLSCVRSNCWFTELMLCRWHSHLVMSFHVLWSARAHIQMANAAFSSNHTVFSVLEFSNIQSCKLFIQIVFRWSRLPSKLVRLLRESSWVGPEVGCGVGWALFALISRTEQDDFCCSILDSLTQVYSLVRRVVGVQSTMESLRQDKAKAWMPPLNLSAMFVWVCNTNSTPTTRTRTYLEAHNFTCTTAVRIFAGTVLGARKGDECVPTTLCKVARSLCLLRCLVYLCTLKRIRE